MATTTADYDEGPTDDRIDLALFRKLKSPQCDGQGAVDIAKLLFQRLEEVRLEEEEADRLENDPGALYPLAGRERSADSR